MANKACVVLPAWALDLRVPPPPHAAIPASVEKSQQQNDGPWDQITSQAILPGVTITSVGGSISQKTDLRDEQE